MNVLQNFIQDTHTPINNVKLKDRINRSTTHLIRWLPRVRHQKRSSKILFQRSEETQLTIPEAFRRARVRAKIHDYPHRDSINKRVVLSLVTPLLTTLLF